MPPRKRARHSVATGRESTTPIRESPVKAESPSYIPDQFQEYADALSSVQHDPWTDEEETLLFKSLVRWKPTGVHKHFRMLSIFEEFRSQGYISSLRGPPAHLRIPGIWAKLYTLYDLDALDQRENAHAGYGSDSSSDEEDEEAEEAENEEDEEAEEESPAVPRDFELPDADVADPTDFGDLMWKRRISEKPDEGFSGPELVKGLSRTRTLPGAKLSGVKIVEHAHGDAEEEVDEENDEKEGEVEAEEEEGEEEGDDNEEEEEEEEEGEEEEGDSEDGEDDDEEEAEEGAEEDAEDENGEEGAESNEEIDESADELANDNDAPSTRTATKPTVKRGWPKTKQEDAPATRRGTRRR